MNRRFYNSLRRVLPPGLLVFVVALLYLPLWTMSAWAAWQYEIDVPEIRLLGDQFLTAVLGLYGAARVFGRHPVFLSDYRRWLEQTPWTSRKPLPRGAVRLGLQDAVVLILAYALLYDAVIDPFWLPIVFLFGYLVTLCVALWLTRIWATGFLLAFGLGLSVRMVSAGTPAVLIVAIVCYAVAWFGIRQSLERFPWPGVDVKWFGDSKQRVAPKPSLGWPFSILTPTDPDELMSRRLAVLTSCLVGWWTYVVLSFVKFDSIRGPMTVMFLGFGLVLLWRLNKYLGNTSAPLTIVGRIGLMRWIIPGYDQVFVAPVLALLVGLTCPVTMHRLGMAPAVYFAVTVGIALLILLAGGPSLRSFKLTGDYHLVPGVMDKTKFVEH